MLSRRNAVAFGVVVVLVGVLGTFAPPARAADDFGGAAKEFIQRLSENAISDLTSQDVPRPERVNRFRTLMDKYFAWRGIAQWVLGRYWPRATPEQQKEYLDLYRELMVLTYVDRFTNYHGERLAVLNSETVDGRDVLVFTQLNRPNSADPLKVEWRVRARGGEFKIVDIMVEGVSMGQTQRSEFASAIKQQGENLDGFLVELRKRVRKGA